MSFPILIWSHSQNDELLPFILDEWEKYSTLHDLKLIVATDSNIELPIEVVRFTKSTWKSEWLEVLSELKKIGYVNIVSILDDFLLLKHSLYEKPEYLFDLFRENKLDYLAIEPNMSHANLISRAFINNNHFVHYDGSEFYPSSLRPSIWSVELLYHSVQSVDNIWQLEHVYFPQYSYATIMDIRQSFKVVHIIEKGKLNVNSSRVGLKDFRVLMESYDIDIKSFIRAPLDFFVHSLIRIFGYRIHKAIRRRIK